MLKKNHLLSFVCLIFFFVLATGSLIVKKASYKDAADWVPKDYNPEKTTLLVEKHLLKKKQNEKMIKFLKDNYPYPFEVVDRQTIMSKKGQYANTDKYKFAVLWEGYSSTSTSYSNGKFSESRKWDMFGYFQNRATGEEFPKTKRYNNYGQKGYIPFFNSVKKVCKK